MMLDPTGQSQMMRCVVLEDEEVVVAERPVPLPDDGQLLVRVTSAGMNGADILQRRGRYPPPKGYPADRPGLEFAGAVVESKADAYAPGARVMGLIPAGGQSEYVTVDHRQVMRVPENMPDQEAGGFCEIFMTAYQALVDQAHLGIGDRVLVNGAAGGVGTAAVQLAVNAGATVVASARNPAAHDLLERYGATPVQPDDAGKEFDIVVELVGAPNLTTDLTALRNGGRVVIIGVGAGAKTELNLLRIINTGARVSGTTLRSMSDEQRWSLTRRAETRLLPLVEMGRISVPVQREFPIEQAAQAFDYFDQPGKIGKVVLRMGGSHV